MPERHLGEQLDRRSTYLRVVRRIWVVPALAAALALVFFLIYTAVIVTVSGQRKYTETSTFYLTFAFNEHTQEYYDNYNAYTWQGLLFTHPGLYETIEKELPEGMTLEEASADTKADLISDIRVLTVDVTTGSTADTAQLSKAIQDALVSFGETAEEFDRIEFLSATEPALVVVSDRSRNAALLGMVLGILVGIVGLWLSEILNDAVYTPEDIRARYGLRTIAVLERDPKKPLPAFLVKEKEENLRALVREEDLSGKESAVYLAALSEDTEKEAAAALNQGSGPSGEERFLPLGGQDAAGKTVVPVLCCGQEKGTRTEHLVARLQDEGAKIPGAVLFRADGAFLARYYREPAGKKNGKN